MKRIIIGLLTAMFATTQVLATPVVVVSSKSRIQSLSKEEVFDIFIGKVQNFQGGPITPVLSAEETTKIFYVAMMGKTENQMRATWARLVFTGKGVPPRIHDRNKDVKKLVRSDPNVISVIELKEVDSSVRIVYP
jgi:ABC-type phosphate transport system substrate-binding protein